MTPEPLLILFLILMVPLAGAGLALLNAGLGRSRTAAHSLLSALCVQSVAAIVYVVCGFALQGAPGMSSHVWHLAGKPWDLIAAAPLFLRGMDWNGSVPALVACLQMFSVGLAALIPLGGGAERWRLGSSCVSAAILAGFTYPLFAHWVWGGGWLSQLGTNFGLGLGFYDGGGSAPIQAVGGLTALAIAWILGPRRGKFTPGGTPTAIAGHNAAFVLFGCILAWAGWMALNSAGAVLFTGAAPARIALVAINTTLSCCSGALGAAAVSRLRFGKPDASLAANGWVCGLAASSAGCAAVAPAAAIVVGSMAGMMLILAIEFLETRWGVDDPGGAIAVHGLGGIWGVLAMGFLAPSSAPGNQWLAQLVGVATLIGFVLPLTYALNWLLNRVSPQRVTVEAERHGVDLHELGSGAYPEFVTHAEESS